MNSKLLLLVGSLVAASTVYAADVCQYTPGQVVCGAGQVSNVAMNGTVELNGTTVTGTVAVNGKLTATNAKLTKIAVNGEASLTNTQVSSTTGVNGLLTAVKSAFAQTIKFSGSPLVLDGSTASTITFTTSDPKTTPILMLKNGSKVSSTVAFNIKAPGTVQLSQGSTVAGKVVNGSTTNQ